MQAEGGISSEGVVASPVSSTAAAAAPSVAPAEVATGCCWGNWLLLHLLSLASTEGRAGSVRGRAMDEPTTALARGKAPGFATGLTTAGSATALVTGLATGSATGLTKGLVAGETTGSPTGSATGPATFAFSSVPVDSELKACGSSTLLTRTTSLKLT